MQSSSSSGSLPDDEVSKGSKEKKKYVPPFLKRRFSQDAPSATLSENDKKDNKNNGKLKKPYGNDFAESEANQRDESSPRIADAPSAQVKRSASLHQVTGRIISEYEPSKQLAGQRNWPQQFNKMFFLTKDRSVIDVIYISRNLNFDFSDVPSISRFYDAISAEYKPHAAYSEPLQGKWVYKYIHAEKRHCYIFNDHHSEMILNKPELFNEQQLPFILVNGKKYILFKIGICAANANQVDEFSYKRYTKENPKDIHDVKSVPQELTKEMQDTDCGNLGMVFGQEGTEFEKKMSSGATVTKYMKNITLNVHIHHGDQKAEDSIQEVKNSLENCRGFFNDGSMADRNYAQAIRHLFEHDDPGDDIHCKSSLRIFSASGESREKLDSLMGIKGEWRRSESDSRSIQQSMPRKGSGAIKPDKDFKSVDRNRSKSDSGLQKGKLPLSSHAEIAAMTGGSSSFSSSSSLSSSQSSSNSSSSLSSSSSSSSSSRSSRSQSQDVASSSSSSSSSSKLQGVWKSGNAASHLSDFFPSPSLDEKRRLNIIRRAAEATDQLRKLGDKNIYNYNQRLGKIQLLGGLTLANIDATESWVKSMENTILGQSLKRPGSP